MKTLKDFIKNWLLPPRVLMLGRRGVRKVRAFSFENRKLFAQNELLKNRHRGKRCFILGAGPSVKGMDLKKLIGEYVISVSQTYLHTDYPAIHPQYHVVPRLFEDCLWADAGKQVETLLREMERKTINSEMFFHISDKRAIDGLGLFKNRIVHWNEYRPWAEGEEIRDIDLSAIPDLWSVSEFALCVAICLGFEKIYMVGFDHNWWEAACVHFYEEQENALHPEEYLAYVDSEFQMRRHAYTFSKYKALRALHGQVFNANANPNTYVDVFPKVDFESLFVRNGK